MSKKLFIVLLCALFPLFFIASASAEDKPITGLWKTIDDETGKKKAIVEIYEQDGKYFGKTIKLFLEPDEDQNPTCDECSDDDPRKDQPSLGMVILENLEKVDGKYKNGEILDPGNGKIYKCKLWLEDGKLRLRGYILFFYRTQTWLPVSSVDE
ncbi:MAG: DUF2147 domain-containing protein [Desulfobacteraceae bacterium]|nr:DUF2147 domain-containing protein [Desulfobacteraceae bacterium]